MIISGRKPGKPKPAAREGLPIPSFFFKESRMGRASGFLSGLFFCLAAVLATVALLAVPETALADAGTDFCNSYCSAQCGSDLMCQTSCYSACYDGYYNCDDCASYSGNQYTWCMAACSNYDCTEDPMNCQGGDGGDLLQRGKEHLFSFTVVRTYV
jgi:hypothetical protein